MSNEQKTLKSKNKSEIEESINKTSSSSTELNIVEKKKYINLYICHLSVGIIFTYIFIMCSITINIVNRVIFWKYKFKFNFTLVLLQQLFCMIFYIRRFLEIKISIYRLLYIFYTQNCHFIFRISIGD